ncbi:RICIN domain-containing protein [Streptomyces sp. NPDC002490]|uniref:RICIN domain-containing protein n=1 Tax=Streptomyces sp. NPDC002490 TaxID=3154416 RepID=UPI00333459F4
MFKRKSLVSVLCSATMAGAGLLAVPGPAQAAVPGTEQFMNVATGRCLESDATDRVYTRVCDAGAQQRWTVSGSTSGYYLKNQVTGRCLDSDTLGEVVTYSCTTAARGRWIVSSSSAYVLRYALSGHCLEGDATGQVHTRTCDAGTHQRWA